MGGLVPELGNKAHVLLGFGRRLGVEPLNVRPNEGRLVVKAVENGGLRSEQLLAFLHQHAALQGIRAGGIESGNDDVQASCFRLLVVGDGGVEEDVQPVHDLVVAESLSAPRQAGSVRLDVVKATTLSQKTSQLLCDR